MRSPITTHVLDIQVGRAAAGVPVSLDLQSDRGWTTLATGVTNADGRIEDLLKPGSRAENGIYRLSFETQKYFSKLGLRSFYPEVSVVFEITDATAHHHVPLLLSAFGYSTYRGT
ncbi:MAG: hydroxyisourate hydrolase [Bdellovibrionota bacterium]